MGDNPQMLNGQATAPSLEKRIKRRIVGREQVFFAAAAPGLEDLVFRELAALPLTRHELAAEKGGIRFTGRLHDAYLANLGLRTAGRVLMRAAEFKAPGYARLKQKLAEVPWELYLPAGAACRVQVSSRHSRVHHSDDCARLVRAAIDLRLAAAGTGPPPGAEPAEQAVFVRAVDDRFTVSVDSSGVNLHKRGVKRQGGKAPLRETLAAAVLALAGYDSGRPLLDPMCGSGTFAIEAAMLAQNIPPGRFREFAFMRWPSFQPGRWQHLLREADAAMTPCTEPAIFASDRDPRTCKALKAIVAAHDWARLVAVARTDFLRLAPSRVAHRPGLVVLNPPYGRRLGRTESALPRYSEILARLQAEYRGWKVALLAPPAVADRLPAAGLRQHRTVHGGLELAVLTGRV